MQREDLRLLFETEKRLLKRRLAQFFPKPASPTEAAKHLGARDKKVRPKRRTEPKADTPIARRRQRRKRRVEVVNWAISIVLHVVLVAILYPHIAPPPRAQAREYEVNLRLLLPEPKEAPPVEVSQPEQPADEAPEEVTPETTPTDESEDEPTETLPSKTDAAESTDAPHDTTEPADLGLAGGGESAPTSNLGDRYGETAKAKRVSRYGGSAASEEAVLAGLDWLARHQDSDGSWSADGFSHHCGGQRCRGGGYSEYRVGVTALATLAFLGAGEDGERDTPNRRVVRAALSYLLSEQDAVGCVGAREKNFMYNHAIAAFAIAEAAALTLDSRYVEATGRALRFSAAAQQPGGGWDYTTSRTMRNDLSVTGWQVMAIHTAAKAGIAVDPRMMERLNRFIRRAVRPNGWATYADRGMGRGRGGVSMVAVGMLSKLYLGWSPSSPELKRGADIVVRHAPAPDARTDWDTSFQTIYYWYYATLAMFHVGGDHWDAWNTYIQRTVLPLQSKRGHEQGSWDPDPNWIGAAGGRVSSTAMAILMFEVYYRYTPLHEKRGTREKPERR